MQAAPGRNQSPARHTGRLHRGTVSQFPSFSTVAVVSVRPQGGDMDSVKTRGLFSSMVEEERKATSHLPKHRQHVRSYFYALVLCGVHSWVCSVVADLVSV